MMHTLGSTARTNERDSSATHRGWLGVSRTRAFVVHLGLSAVLIAAAAVAALGWYPQPYAAAVNVWSIARIPLLIFLAVGPLLTLILFKPGKRGLLIDVVVVALLQLGAYAHGLSILERARPAFAVFTVDRFVLLSERDIDATQLAAARASHGFDDSARGPALVVALLPADEAERQRLLDETVFQGKPDIERRPELWHAFASERRQGSSRQKSLAALRAARPAAAGEIDRAVASLGVAEANLGFVPLVAGSRHVAAIVDTRAGVPLAVVDADPWVED